MTLIETAIDVTTGRGAGRKGLMNTLQGHGTCVTRKTDADLFWLRLTNASGVKRRLEFG